ncbi:MAG: cytochrome c oxidase accessory protein CcoG [Rhodospirillaceae bacterium]|nr:cytochrome c oxidase accessory protein CcoG [Rhodospirillaceae bacterium]
MVQSEDVLSRQEQRSQPLYTGRVKVYPKAIKGRVRRVKWAVLGLCLAVYYLLPWVRWDRGPNLPDQAVLLDLPNRRFYLFWIEIWPQEIYYLTALLIIASFTLFMATSIGGRVWCGFTCPQTVWTDLFMKVEHWIEGDRNARMRLDAQPLSRAKLTRKLAKHAVWLLIALLTGGAWIMYFVDAPHLVAGFVTGGLDPVTYFFIFLFTATTYVLAGAAREQVCTYMCPWPRFQAALLDEDSLVVTYRQWRGEPRGKHKKGQSWEGRGDCIDCKQCVAVCPTGIDIRDGIQLECIGCGLCIDACDSVMAKVDRPLGLIAFDSDRNQRLNAAGQPPVSRRSRLVRPRTIIYAFLITGITLALLTALTLRSQLDVNVLHDRNPLFVTLSDGSIRNGYTIHVINMGQDERMMTLTVDGLPEAQITVVGAEQDDAVSAQLDVTSDAVLTYRVFVSVPAAVLQENATDIAFVFHDPDSGLVSSHDSVFRGP